jgi:phosphoserine phosphatase RsbU/P
MKILVAADDPTCRLSLESILAAKQYAVTSVGDGISAWDHLLSPEPAPLAILDWVMRGMEGEEICRQLRQFFTLTPTYIILLTRKGSPKDIALGFQAGANDYVRKPFHADELLARLRVGEQVIRLQKSLVDRLGELQGALSKIETLQGLLPICSSCKRIRNDQTYRQEVESYISQNSEAKFNLRICPDCLDKHLRPKLSKEFQDDFRGGVEK